MPADRAADGPYVSADDLRERRRAERRLRLMEVSEDLAAAAEAATTDRLRDAYAARYRARIGVPPARRDAFREALRGRVNVTVDELVARFAGG